MKTPPPLGFDEHRSALEYLEFVEVAILVLDPEGRVTLINRKGCGILGVTREEILGENWFQRCIPEAGRAQPLAVHRDMVRGLSGERQQVDTPVVTAGGETRLIAWDITVLRDSENRVVGTVGAGEDVTERRRLETQLRQSHKDLEDIEHALDQAAIVAATDHRGIIYFVNDKFCQISRYSREELVGQDHRIVNSAYHPKEFFRDLWRTIAQGQIWKGEIRNRAKGGSFYWVDTTIVPFLDKKGRPFKYLAIRNDITARKTAERELRKSEALAQLGQLAAVVAHEVRNPLAGIAGAIEIIGKRLPDDSPDRQVIPSILERIDALNERLKDLLLFARPRPPGLAPVRLGTLLRETTGLLSRDPRCSRVRVILGSEDPAMLGDAELLKDVFLNLLLNAAQATDGRGEVRVDLEAHDGTLRVSVADNGPGITPEIRERMFEPFFTTKSAGSGLGLAIARQIVRAHGGEIDGSPTPGGGTTMVVRLPAHPPDATPPRRTGGAG